MFTGIISGIGKVTHVQDGSATATSAPIEQRVLTIDTPYRDAVLGESIAINGVCLTVAEILSPGNFKFFVSSETCARTNLGALATNMTVNLERAMRLQDRLSGHLVQGHVDGVGPLLAVRQAGESRELEIQLPPPFLKYVIEKGSITLDGISLTVNSIKNSVISLMIIPHTWEHTTLCNKQIGQDFNIELDVIAKHIERLMKPLSS